MKPNDVFKNIIWIWGMALFESQYLCVTNLEFAIFDRLKLISLKYIGFQKTEVLDWMQIALCSFGIIS
ncbi:unnamed protein product [Blepharisma stoltei]|uniref:Uncharacterized protein n=1 Tax=Blepharisma stoltei TaxID=1481888 RepID=A0AAU9JCK4_9CILI|nr:unnamed protein product [Blepharisma stoltei]